MGPKRAQHHQNPRRLWQSRKNRSKSILILWVLLGHGLSHVADVLFFALRRAAGAFRRGLGFTGTGSCP